MRSFLLQYILAWVFGSVIGVADVGLRWLFVFLLIIGFIGWHIKRGKHRTFALVFLTFLGFIHGLSGNQAELVHCDINSHETGIVTNRPNIRINQVQFHLRIKECLILTSASPFLDVQKGDEVIINGGSIQSLDDIRNYSKGYADYLERKRISYTWSYADVKIRRSNTQNSHKIIGQVQKLHITLSNRVQKLFVEPDASILSAMLLAEKGRIPEDIVERFRATGVSHILAISGLHVAIIAGLIFAIVSYLPLTAWWRTGLVTGVLWTYVLFIGYPISAIRAASFVTVALLFFRLNKLVSMPTALILTVAAIVTIKPNVILDVGFQLSASAVAGIFLTLFLAQKVSIPSNKKGILSWVYSLILVSFGATLFTWPLVAYHFGTISLIGLLANLLVVPLVPLLLWTAIIAMIISFIWMPGALLLAGLSHLCIWWLLFITKKLASLPGVYYEEITISFWLVVIYYLIIGIGTIVLVRRQKRSWLEIWG